MTDKDALNELLHTRKLLIRVAVHYAGQGRPERATTVRLARNTVEQAIMELGGKY